MKGHKEKKEEMGTLIRNNIAIYVLVITHDRPELLSIRTFPSIQRQSHPISGLVLVDDSEIYENRVKNEMLLISANLPQSIYLLNKCTPGAAGAWNTGIDWIYEKDKEAWIAILDDDDEWEANHIQVCIDHIANNHAVISGINIIKDKNPIENISQEFSLHKFLEGNPGWQGSNTFIQADFIKKIGGFDERLFCTHDRNLAIRCFEDSSFRYSITDECTVIYHLESERPSLTNSEGFGKVSGLLQFYDLHHKKMNNENKDKFKKRAIQLFQVNPDLFDLVENTIENQGFERSPWISENKWNRLIITLKYYLKKKWSIFRMNKRITTIFGPQFKPTTDQIEIDITYECNLHCQNCNRSCRQAPEKLEIELSKIQEFVSDSIQNKINWKRIRILGGEPTLHSQFEKILYNLINYKLFSPSTRLEIVTNGFGKVVKRKLLVIPPFFHIENSHKNSTIQQEFIPFNLAPQDDNLFKDADYRNGCSNLTECGIALTPLGYYPCSLAGGIDRILGKNLGIQRLPINTKQLSDLLSHFCSLCGRFQSRIFIPYNLRPKLKEELVSKSWKQLYDKWEKKKRDFNHGSDT